MNTIELATTLVAVFVTAFTGSLCGVYCGMQVMISAVKEAFK